MPVPQSPSARVKTSTYPIPLHMVPMSTSPRTTPSRRPATPSTALMSASSAVAMTKSSSPQTKSNMPSFSFARDTKASIARAAPSRHPSAASGASTDGRVVSPAGSRSATPVPRAILDGWKKVGAPTPPKARVQVANKASVTEADNGRAAPVDSSIDQSQTTPQAQQRMNMPSHSMPSCTNPSRSTPTLLTRARTPTPQPGHISPSTAEPTPRSRPLPAIPPHGSPTPKVTRILHPGPHGSAMSFYDRLSSLTSSTRGTVGRANSAKVSKSMDLRSAGMYKGNIRERGLEQGQVKGEGVSVRAGLRKQQQPSATPTTTTTPTRAAPATGSNAHFATPTKSSHGGSWLKRMGSTRFALSAQRIASPCTSPQSRAKQRIGYTPSTPVHRGVGQEAGLGGDKGSPWISARTLAIEDPIPASSAEQDLGADHSARSHGSGEKQQAFDRQSRHELYSSSDSSSRTTRRAEIVKRDRTPSDAYLRDVEREWKAALEVEAMSHAESECLARAECISVYDPWGDCPVLQFGALFQPPISHTCSFGNVTRIASIRSVGSGMAHKKSVKGNIGQGHNPVAANQPPQVTNDRHEDICGYHEDHGDLARTPSVTAPLRIPSGKKGDRKFSRSGTISSSSSLGSTVLLSTPATPLRSRNASSRLQGDMRDELDYLYDNFTLDDNTPQYRRDGASVRGQGGEGEENDMASPWQLVLASPSFRRMYEGMAVDEGWVLPPSPTKVRSGRLRRIETLGSLKG